VAEDDAVIRCGAATKSGAPCRNPVPHPGDRCHLHTARPPAAPPPPAPAEPGPTEPTATEPGPAQPAGAPVGSAPAGEIPAGEGPEGEGDDPAAEPPDPRVVRAAQRCEAVIATGAMEAVDALATPYLGENGWNQLRQSWRRENCALLSRVAREALNSPVRMHDAAGKLAAQVWIWLGRPWLEQMMVREVVKRLPILGEGQVRPVARAVQLAGLRLCHGQHGDLTRCPCFVDLVENEGERRPRQLLEAGVKGWDGLARLR
jgi:hypothetical protein